MSILEIVKNYMYEAAEGLDVGSLEGYVDNEFKGYTKADLKKYCNEEGVFYKRKDCREILLDRIYGICNFSLGSRLLMYNRYTEESEEEFYKRVYEIQYK